MTLSKHCEDWIATYLATLSPAFAVKIAREIEVRLVQVKAGHAAPNFFGYVTDGPLRVPVWSLRILEPGPMGERLVILVAKTENGWVGIDCLLDQEDVI